MSPKSIRRGYDPEDAARFSPESLAMLRKAQQEVHWLLDRGYRSESAVQFVGNRYQLALRQRIALARATASTLQCGRRNAAKLPLCLAKEGHLLIDGFNMIINLEVALSGSLMILCNDGVFRDLAGLRGSYGVIGQTEKALALIGDAFRQLAIPGATFLLDAPVSNSGRLKELIRSHASGWGIPVEVALVPNADHVLAGEERIVSGDSGVLDACASWLDITGMIIREYLKNAWIIRLEEGALSLKGVDRDENDDPAT